MRISGIKQLFTAGLTACLLLLIPFAPADAGPKEAERTKVEPKKIEQPPGGLNLMTPDRQQAENRHKLNVAREMIRSRNYEAAAALLETIYSAEPDNQVVLNLLRNCYEQTGQHAKSELLLERMIEMSPNSHVLHVYLAESLVNQGDTTRAVETYNRAIDLVENNPRSNIGFFRQIVSSMRVNQLGDRALNLIDRLRNEENDQTLFALDAGEIFESRREYKKAAEQFYVAMEDTTRIGIEAENKLTTMLGFEESGAAAEEVLLAHTDDSTAQKASRLLSNHYVRSDQLDRALEYALLEDSLTGGNGVSLLVFMRTCVEREIYKEATVVGEEISKRYPDSPILGEAQFLYGLALRRMGRPEFAIAVYDSIIAAFPRVQDKAEAGYRIGDIYLNDLFDYRAALAIFDSVTTHYRGGLGYLHAQLATPITYLRMGQLEKARQEYVALNQQRRLNEETAEEVAFNLARIDFFDKKFDSASAGLNRILVEYPRGYYVNDALRLMLAIEEAGQAKEVLYDYSNALFFEERRMYDSTEAKLHAIAEDDNPLADVALYKLATMKLDQFDTLTAVQTIDSLTTRFPESYYMPFGLKIKGEIALADPALREQGKKLFRILLEEFPNYPFISEVRQRLRELDLDSRTG